MNPTESAGRTSAFLRPEGLLVFRLVAPLSKRAGPTVQRLMVAVGLGLVKRRAGGPS